MKDCSDSWYLKLIARDLICFFMKAPLRASSSRVFCATHWNGVCPFGTKPATDTLIAARLL